MHQLSQAALPGDGVATGLSRAGAKGGAEQTGHPAWWVSEGHRGLENAGFLHSPLWVLGGSGCSSAPAAEGEREDQTGTGTRHSQGRSRAPGPFQALGVVLQSSGCRERGLEPPELAREGGQAQERTGRKAEGISINDWSPFSLREGKGGRDGVPDPIAGMGTACVCGGGSQGEILNPITPQGAAKGNHPGWGSTPHPILCHPGETCITLCPAGTQRCSGKRPQPFPALQHPKNPFYNHSKLSEPPANTHPHSILLTASGPSPLRPRGGRSWEEVSGIST